MFLRDLTFIEDGNKTWNNEQNAINIGKLVMIGIKGLGFNCLFSFSSGKIVSRALEIQKTPYRLFRVPIIIQYFEKYDVLSLEEREEKLSGAEVD